MVAQSVYVAVSLTAVFVIAKLLVVARRSACYFLYHCNLIGVDPWTVVLKPTVLPAVTV